MRWRFFEKKQPSLEEGERMVLTSEKTLPRPLEERLLRLDFGSRWELIRRTLDRMEATKARNLVRLLFGNNIPGVLGLLEVRQERELAVECLGYLPSRETAQVLVSLLRVENQRDDGFQLLVAGTLKRHPPRLVVPLLIKGLLDESLSPARAGDVLLAMDYLGQEALLEAYPRATPRVKGRFLELFVLGQNPKCKPFVVQAVREDNWELKRAALEAVRAFAFTDVWPDLISCLSSPDWKVRVKALELLGELKIKGAIKYVRPLLEDEDPRVRACAVDCLKSWEGTAAPTIGKEKDGEP